MSIDTRPLKSGKTVYDVRLRDPHGRLYKRTFRTKREAERFQAGELTDRARGAWVDPRLGRVTLGDYGSRWLVNRPDLRPRTRELYQGLLRLHIVPALGHLELGAITTSVVRSWRGGDAGGAPARHLHYREVLSAPARHPQHGRAGRGDRQESLQHQGGGC